jgi:hypothetical protein
MAANDRQVGGEHYQNATGKCPHCQGVIQHWDLYGRQPYLVGQTTKYVTRRKDGAQDLVKALHFLVKLAETEYGINVLAEYEGERKPEAKEGK